MVDLDSFDLSDDVLDISIEDDDTPAALSEQGSLILETFGIEEAELELFAEEDNLDLLEDSEDLSASLLLDTGENIVKVCQDYAKLLQQLVDHISGLQPEDPLKKYEIPRGAFPYMDDGTFRAFGAALFDCTRAYISGTETAESALESCLSLLQSSIRWSPRLHMEEFRNNPWPH